MADANEETTDLAAVPAAPKPYDELLAGLASLPWASWVRWPCVEHAQRRAIPSWRYAFKKDGLLVLWPSVSAPHLVILEVISVEPAKPTYDLDEIALVRGVAYAAGHPPVEVVIPNGAALRQLEPALMGDEILAAPIATKRAFLELGLMEHDALVLIGDAAATADEPKPKKRAAAEKPPAPPKPQGHLF